MGARKKIFLAPEEMDDLLPQEQFYWNRLRQVINQLSGEFGFNRIDTPMLEKRDLFIKGLAGNNQAIEKSFFNLTTKKRDKLVLRPDLTLPIFRACIENQLTESFSSPIKLFSFGPVFSYQDFPPLGRKQSYQANFQVIGGASPVLDAQLIQFFRALLGRLGVKKTIIEVNCIGCAKCRANYRKSLTAYYRCRKDQLCPDCLAGLSTNPLNLLTCHKDVCSDLAQEAPQAIDFLCENCRAHLRELLEYLDELEIPYMLNPRVVGPFDYYNKTVFKIHPEEEEFANFVLAEGGRCDNLFKFLSGYDMPTLGLTTDLNCLVDFIKQARINPLQRKKDSVFLIQLGAEAKKRSLSLFDELRKLNIAVNGFFGENSLKLQLEEAEKVKSRFALILGQKEVMDESIIVRDMESGIQELVPLAKVAQYIKRKLKETN